MDGNAGSRYSVVPNTRFSVVLNRPEFPESLLEKREIWEIVISDF